MYFKALSVTTTDIFHGFIASPSIFLEVRVSVFIPTGMRFRILSTETARANVANAIHYYTSLWKEENKWKCDSIGSNSLATDHGVRLSVHQQRRLRYSPPTAGSWSTDISVTVYEELKRCMNWLYARMQWLLTYLDLKMAEKVFFVLE
jgi:hypothetical protein